MEEQNNMPQENKVKQENGNKKMSRRGFLQTLGKLGLGLGAVTVAGLGTEKGQAQAETEPQGTIDAPASLMLHARGAHERLLPGLLEQLRAQGYEGITYSHLLGAMRGETTLPEKPIIISIDDLSMARGVPAYDTFKRMAQILMDNNFPGVFAVNTNPEQDQDDSHWQEVAEWANHGIELATHTSMHTNLAAGNLRPEHYQAEIVGSAAEIERRTGQHVDTLILPFGNGYNLESGEINPNIITSCREAGIHFVIGIVGGRENLDPTQVDEGIYLIGRAMPGVEGNESPESAMWEINRF